MTGEQPAPLPPVLLGVGVGCDDCAYVGLASSLDETVTVLHDADQHARDREHAVHVTAQWYPTRRLADGAEVATADAAQRARRAHRERLAP